MRPKCPTAAALIRSHDNQRVYVSFALKFPLLLASFTQCWVRHPPTGTTATGPTPLTIAACGHSPGAPLLPTGTPPP